MKLKDTKPVDDTKVLLDRIISWEKDLSEYPSLESILRSQFLILERKRHDNTTNSLFDELCSYINNTKYGEGYEFNFQLWNSMYTIFVSKDDVELTSISRDTPEEAMEATLEYLKRIKARKPLSKGSKQPIL